MTPEQALEKVKLQLIYMLKNSEAEIKLGTKEQNEMKVGFHTGAKVAMDSILEMIYKDTIELK